MRFFQPKHFANKIIRIIIRNHVIIELGILLAIAIFFRFWRLGDIPYGLNNDAAWEGSAAIDMLRGNWHDYVPYASESWRGEPIIRILVMVLMYIWGPSPITIRLASAILGVTLIIPLFFLIKTLFADRLAFLTTALVATSGWHSILSRSGWRAISVPTFVTMTFLACIYAYRSNRRIWFVLAGVSLALTAYTYDSARVIPLCLCIGMLLYSRRIIRWARGHMNELIIGVGTFLICAGPLILFAITHASGYTGRSTYLFVGSKVVQTQSLRPIWENVYTTFFMFHKRGNGNDFFIEDPLLDSPITFLFPFGLGIAAWYAVIRKKRGMQFMLCWFAISLIPGLLSSPNGNRNVGAIPPIYFFAALGASTMIDWYIRWVPTKKRIVAIWLAFIVWYCAGFASYHIYLGPWRREVPGFYPEAYTTLRYIKPYISTHDIYITDNFPKELLMFLLYQGGDPWKKHYMLAEHGLLSTSPSKNRPSIFIMRWNPDNQMITQVLLRKYPKSTFQIIYYIDDSFRRPAAILVTIPIQP
jgi:Dolichyl-phosphate-mannose-protein mannosyltransferase